VVEEAEPGNRGSGTDRRGEGRSSWATGGSEERNGFIAEEANRATGETVGKSGSPAEAQAPTGDDIGRDAG
jgi:hypothetical protein